MIVIMAISARIRDIARVTDRIRAMGYDVHLSKERLLSGASTLVLAG